MSDLVRRVDSGMIRFGLDTGGAGEIWQGQVGFVLETMAQY